MYSLKSKVIKSFSIFWVTVFYLCIFSTATLVSNANAATLAVPSQYSTIQSAIDSAVTGDTVLVSDGTYTENINFNGKAIIVTSVNGASSTTINGNAAGSVVTFGTGETSGSILEGFTITNGSAGAGGGINCQYSSPAITNCMINSNTADFGGGICCGASSPIITNCTISGNLAKYCGGGIYISALSYAYSSPTIINCTISNNTAGTLNTVGQGGGFCFDRYSYPTVTNSILWGNYARLNPEMYVDTLSTITVTYLGY